VLRILRSLPYGNSIFFVVKRIEDPIGLLPGRIILGINKRGIHFFRPVPKEYLHSAELRDIMQFGSSHSAVFFKMRVAGVLHIFQFETKQVRGFLKTSPSPLSRKEGDTPNRQHAVLHRQYIGGDAVGCVRRARSQPYRTSTASLQRRPPPEDEPASSIQMTENEIEMYDGPRPSWAQKQAI